MQRLKLAVYYTRLAWRDLVRLWPTTQHHVIIVAGICLPILLLLGLKRGHVADLRRELLTSPSGRQVVFWSAQHGELLDAPAVERLQKELTGVELIIPDQERLVSVSTKDTQDGLALTLYSTVAGDPILKQVEAELDGRDERQIVLAHAVAQRLGASPGDKLTLRVERRQDEVTEYACLDVGLCAILPDNGDERSAIGYADSKLLDKLEQYVRGYRVEAFQWPAIKASVRDKYSAYLAFCESGNDYRDADLDALKERGLNVVPVDDADLKALYGAIKQKEGATLRVYKIASVSSESDALRRLILAPSDISEMTEADEVILPWNHPQTFEIEGSLVRLFGLSLPKRCWLREYLSSADLAFVYDAPTYCVRPLDETSTIARDGSLRIPLKDDKVSTLSLEVLTRKSIPPASDNAAPPGSQRESNGSTQPNSTAPYGNETDEPSCKDSDNPEPRKDETSSGPRANKPFEQPSTERHTSTMVVPVDMLAQLDAFRHGTAEYDSVLQMFVPRAESPVYGKARAYAKTIDEVPAVVTALTSLAFAVESQNSRIMEIHGQDQSLQILVWVVGFGVFLFGVVTTVSVLTDSTDRKRGTIGILRVMGVSRLGVFYITVLRAAAIGLLAGITAACVGCVLAAILGWEPSSEFRYLEWKPCVTVLLHPLDLGTVFLGALLCSGLGAILPAWKASRLDPFEAIVEGRFR